MNGHELVKAIENMDLDLETNVSDVAVIEGAIIIVLSGDEPADVETVTDVGGVISRPTIHRRKRK